MPEPVTTYLLTYVQDVLPSVVVKDTLETPLFWVKWGRPVVGRTVQPMTGKNVWRLFGVPELKPHDLRHGVLMRASGPPSSNVRSGSTRKGRGAFSVTKATMTLVFEVRSGKFRRTSSNTQR